MHKLLQLNLAATRLKLVTWLKFSFSPSSIIDTKAQAWVGPGLVMPLHLTTNSAFGFFLQI